MYMKNAAQFQYTKAEKKFKITFVHDSNFT